MVVSWDKMLKGSNLNTQDLKNKHIPSIETCLWHLCLQFSGSTYSLCGINILFGH